ncbi:GAF domain-containing protein [Nocardioides zeae]
MRPSGLAVRGDGASLRRPIADSWRRAELAGLTPATAFDGLRYDAVDTTSALLVAAAPVLDNLNERLTGTGFTTLLVDRDGRVARRWSSDERAGRAFDSLGVAAGASLLEDRIGTNAPGTVLETRASIMVNADEHFAEPLRAVSCFGQPIVHPVTRRIEGVLDVSALMAAVNPSCRRSSRAWWRRSSSACSTAAASPSVASWGRSRPWPTGAGPWSPCTATPSSATRRRRTC